MDKGFEFSSEEARQTAIARLVRRDEGTPYWMIPGDDLAFEAFLAEHTTAISGEADGAVKLPKIPHQTLSLVGMDVTGAWEFNVAPEDGAGSTEAGGIARAQPPIRPLIRVARKRRRIREPRPPGLC